MTVIRDRRDEPLNDKFGIDKERFRMRYLKRIKKAIQDNIAEGNLDDIGKGGIKVPIPKDTVREPFLHHRDSGQIKRVFPGNNTRINYGGWFQHSGTPSSVFPGNIAYDVDDVVPIPKGGGGGGGGDGDGNGKDPSDQDSDAEDDFVWVNESDYLDILFEGRSLPDMTKLKAESTVVTDREHSGYTNKGPDHRMDMEITNRKRREESIVLAKGAERRIFKNLSEQFNIMAQYSEDLDNMDLTKKTKAERNEAVVEACKPRIQDDEIDLSNSKQVIALFQDTVENLYASERLKVTEEEEERLQILENRLGDQLKGQNRSQKFREEHLTYEYDDDVPVPNAKAVMFCQMDVSGSMGQEEKNTAKVFFWLLKRFLDAKYDEVDVVFIAHTTDAEEVDEQEFFYGTKTGGTIVSTCLEKTQEIIKERYPVGEWNIYSAQASDGDNSPSDNNKIAKLMEEMLPILQAHYYVEIDHPYYQKPSPSPMYQTYDALSDEHNGKVHVEWGLGSAADALDAFKKFFPVGGKQPANNNNPAPN